MQERTLSINVFESIEVLDVLSINIKQKVSRKFFIVMSIDSFVRSIIGVTSFSRSPDFSI